MAGTLHLVRRARRRQKSLPAKGETVTADSAVRRMHKPIVWVPAAFHNIALKMPEKSPELRLPEQRRTSASGRLLLRVLFGRPLQMDR